MRMYRAVCFSVQEDENKDDQNKSNESAHTLVLQWVMMFLTFTLRENVYFMLLKLVCNMHLFFLGSSVQKAILNYSQGKSQFLKGLKICGSGFLQGSRTKAAIIITQGAIQIILSWERLTQPVCKWEKRGRETENLGSCSWAGDDWLWWPSCCNWDDHTSLLLMWHLLIPQISYELSERLFREFIQQ